MKIMNRLFATAFVAILLFASHSRAEQDTVQEPASACEAGEADAPY